jgi:hypothetical protein
MDSSGLSIHFRTWIFKIHGPEDLGSMNILFKGIF